MRRAISNIILIAALIVLSYALFQLGKYAWSYFQEDQANNEIRAIAGEDVAKDKKSSYEKLLAKARKRVINFEKLQAKNPEIIAWVWIPGTNIDYPITQTTNNSYYLYRNAFKKHARSGSVFLDYTLQPDFSNPDSIIYGHHMRDGSMFAGLAKYRKNDYAKKFSHFFIYTPTKTIEYTYAEQGLVRPSQFIPKTSDDPDKRFLTLITCEYDFNDARLFVRGKLHKEFAVGGGELPQLSKDGLNDLDNADGD